jgi:dTDP-D-glucose 4,6-dehydratase
VLGWEPAVSFREGLGRTVAWYLSARSREDARRLLREGALFDRVVASSP